MGLNTWFWPKDFWPPQSLDLNPLDYSVWVQIEGKACTTRHSNVDALKSSVNRAWTSVGKDYASSVCASFRPRLERVMAAEGGHID